MAVRKQQKITFISLLWRVDDVKTLRGASFSPSAAKYLLS